MSHHPLARWIMGSLLAALVATVAFAGEKEREVAARVDRLLREEVPLVGTAKSAPDRIGDQQFLRRVSLDLIGRLPSPDEITVFALDPAADKRAQVVSKLLAENRFGQNWGRYWRDVIMYRKTEERQQFLVGIPLESYLADALNENRPWSQLATEMITAKGGANSNGACGLIVAQQGQPEEIVGEVSRIFLGVQIQCAQCHDHPTDRWTREQFHQLAAFFPRVASQPSRPMQTPGVLPEITVTVTDRNPLFNFRPMNMRIRGTTEHKMTDPKDPQADGTVMQPVFFATGESLPIGTPDAERRGNLARWMTSADNPFFAKAFVNRLWAELTGEGFCEPVDDLGPDRTATAPRALEALAADFSASGYDIKRLFRVIMATDMYQHPTSAHRGPEEPPMQHNVAQRLRADQVLDNLLLALELPEPAPRGGGLGPMARIARSPRTQFTAVFGYDPSARRDEIQTSIPQALSLMNTPNVAAAMSARGNTMLARRLAAIAGDEALVQELYLQVLAREPTTSETETSLRYIRETGSREEAFEDLLWALLNSAEFLHRI